MRIKRHVVTYAMHERVVPPQVRHLEKRCQKHVLLNNNAQLSVLSTMVSLLQTRTTNRATDRTIRHARTYTHQSGAMAELGQK